MRSSRARVGVVRTARHRCDSGFERAEPLPARMGARGRGRIAALAPDGAPNMDLLVADENDYADVRRRRVIVDGALVRLAAARYEDPGSSRAAMTNDTLGVIEYEW